MRIYFATLSLAFVFIGPASAAYDGNWYKTDYWSGEYPGGFSVVKKGVSVPARAAMDKDLALSLNCALPYKAVFSPWNEKRNKKSKVSYFTAAKIIRLIAKENFFFESVESEQLPIRKGQVIEH